MPDRDFDVILYGATGFTGRQTVRYFAEHAPSSLRWAIAGRNVAKLEALDAKVPHFAADSSDQPALDALAARTRVILSTAGPFALYSDGLVDACVRQQTHWVDITGETVWVRSLIDRHHAKAAAEGTRIIPFCGFDCVPCDLGVFWIANQLGPETSEVKGYFQAKNGTPNGGTMATALLSVESGAMQKMREPFLLNPSPRTPLPTEADPKGARYDADIQAWVAPWVMGSIDTRVVRRSAALLGRDFAYQEYAKFDSRLAASLVAGATGLLEGGLRFAAFRKLLRRIEPGSGPDEKTMESGWFRCELFARTKDGRTAHALMSGQGDPANRITVKCVCESALALACDTGALPDRAGVLTPSTGIGQVLIDRLALRGITIAKL